MSNLLKSKIVLGVIGAAVLAFAGSASAAYVHTVTLKMGVTNAQVMSLQQTLNSTACQVGLAGTAGGPGTETMYFGAKTSAAVKCFQASKGLTADGIVGPMTGAALGAVATGNFPAGCTSASGYSTTTGLPCNTGPSSGFPAGCTSAVGYSPITGKKCDGSDTPSNNGPLTGGAGDITISALSDFGDEEVGEGDEDVEVLAFEIEADDGSDVEITSVKVEFSQETAADSEDLTDYAESVSIMMNGEVVGSADAEDFSENSDIWTKSISLDGAIVRSGDEEEFSVAITALANLDSGDIDTDDWQVGVSSVRFVDGEDVVTTDSLTLDVGDNVLDDTLEEQFNFASFATASDVELEVSLTDDQEDINEAHSINIDDSDDTDDVEILAFTLEADGSDISVSEIPVLFTTVEATGNDPDDLMSTARLWKGDDVIGTESFLTSDGDDSSETITFDDLEIDIEEGDTVDLVVTVDVQDTGSTLDAGDTIMADLTATEVDAIEAEDESGEDLLAADLVGTANGEASEVRDTGIQVDLVSVDIEKSVACDGPCATGTGESAEATIVFDVTSFDADAWLTNGVDEDGTYTAGSGLTTATTMSAAGGTSTGAYTVTNDPEDSTHIRVPEGETVRVTLVVNVTKATDPGFVSVALAGVEWNDADSTVTPFNYTFNLDEFETANLYLNQTD